MPTMGQLYMIRTHTPPGLLAPCPICAYATGLHCTGLDARIEVRHTTSTSSTLFCIRPTDCDENQVQTACDTELFCRFQCCAVSACQDGDSVRSVALPTRVVQSSAFLNMLPIMTSLAGHMPASGRRLWPH